MKTAFVTGLTGQDGTFLTKLLLSKDYKVVGLTRRVSTEPPVRVRGKFDFSEAIAAGLLVLEQGDLLSRVSLDRIISEHQPDEVYNLAAQSHVATSFKQPEFTFEADCMGVINLLSSLEACHKGEWRFYQAGTSEMYGSVKPGTVLNEDSLFHPCSPYSISKLAAHYYCQMKRAQGYFICSGILFNHESEIRGGDFVTQKIAMAVANWDPASEAINLGNLDSHRDWGYAGDYVEGMWLILQQDKPDDYVIATGETRSVRNFVELAFKSKGFDIEWRGKAENEKGYIDNHLAVVINSEFYRPNEVGYLLGDSSKIRAIGWEQKTSFDKLVSIMVG